MITNADCTVYVQTNTDGELSYKRHYIEDVYWQENLNVRVGDKGLESADSITVLIPLSQLDGYVEVKDYTGAGFCLDNGYMIVRGNCPLKLTDHKSVRTLKAKYKVAVICSVRDKRYGSRVLQHIALEART